MSRNLRHKSSASPAKQSARRASHHADNSSDDDYAGVDLISDSEDDEPDVEAAEEQAIIESAEEDDGDNELADVPQPDNDQSSWNGFDDEPVLGGDEAFFDDHMARSHAPDTLTHATTYNATHGNSSDERETPRRVRFDLSASSEDEDDSMFPDIFLDQNSLDPGFRRIIESNHGIDEHMASSEDGSYWDYRGEEHRNVVEVPDDESDGSSGYESGLPILGIDMQANKSQLMRAKLLKKIFQMLPSIYQHVLSFAACPKTPNLKKRYQCHDVLLSRVDQDSAHGFMIATNRLWHSTRTVRSC